MANLYVVATPIGNLEDISLRAVNVLKEVDLILCEDTRRTKILLDRYQINKPLLSYHQHSRLKKVNYILDLLRQGKNLALVSEAGIPGISDPGNKLISLLVDKFRSLKIKNLQTYSEAELRNLTIIPIPGPSALTAALSISGFPADQFIFLGFPPHKKGRQKFFQEIANSKYTVVFYESPYRIIKTLKELKNYLQTYKLKNLSTKVVICRELTKKFETVYRGTIDDVLEEVKKDKILGEYTIVISRPEGARLAPMNIGVAKIK